MEIETINGIMDVDLSKVTLNDVCDIITKISVDAGVSNNAPTAYYIAAPFVVIEQIQLQNRWMM